MNPGAPQRQTQQKSYSSTPESAQQSSTRAAVPPPPPTQMIKSKDHPCSFSINEPKHDTFYFTLNEQGQPIKLGDGTYGIVYEVHDAQNRMYAAKLLYLDQETERSEKRFQSEMNSAGLINKLIDEQGGDRSLVAGVIETAGGTDQFHESPAFKTFGSFFGSLRVSNYVLVMPKYEKNLKQILEEEREGFYTLSDSQPIVSEYFPSGTPIVSAEDLDKQIHSQVEKLNLAASEDEKSAVVQSLKSSVYPVTGYELLRRMTFEERISTMYPYIYAVAEGLTTLHQVELLHLDLKPANIFVKRRGNKIEAVVGDLGFLDEANRHFREFSYKPYMEKTNQPSLPLGTRHYRSPEQKDFFDVADVEVNVDSEIELIIKDPKFNDTIIEKLDVVSFSQYKQEFEIANVRTEQAGEIHSYSIQLDKGQLDDISVIKSDKRTQVYFYKRQRHRTDLFGFGALIFELLTCGQSPERFYDAIRAYDTAQDDIESIMDLYKQISNFQATEPGLVQIFSPFKLQEASSTYAPPEIVRLILKCMLYKAKNRFYSPEDEHQSPGSTMRRVTGVLNDLYHNEGRQFESLELVSQNSLYRTIPRITASSPKASTEFLHDLDVLTHLSKRDFPKRLCQGIQKFEKLISLVQNFADTDFFFEVIPSNLTQDKSGLLRPRYTAYKDQNLYIDDLIKDSLYTKVSRNLSDPYVPNFLTFIRRSIILEDVKYNSSHTPATLDCSWFHTILCEVMK